MASLFVMVLMWRRRQSLGARAMIALVVATFVWTLGFFIEANSDTLERQLFFNNIGYLGSMSVPVAWFIFAVNYTNGRRMVTGWKVILLCIIPFITVTLVWSNSWHNLMWSNEHLRISGPFLVTAKTYGPFFWGALTYNYILIVAGTVILMRRLFVGIPLYTGQAVSLIVAVSLPLVWNIIYVFNLVPLPRKDLTPVMFAISGIAIALGLMRFRLFTAIPFAHKFIIQQLSNGVFVFDIHNRLLEANPAALKILGVDKSIVGKGLEDLLSLSPVFEYLSSQKSGRVDLPSMVSIENRFYELEVVSMHDNREQQMGWLATLHDITERRTAKEQYQLLADHVADIIYRLRIKDERFIYVSPSVERVLGYTIREALTLKPEDLLTVESYEKQKHEMLKDIEKGISNRTLQLEAIRKDGHIVPIEVNASLVNDESGEPMDIIGVIRDITVQKQMEQALKESEQRYSSLFRYNPDAVYAFDLNGRFVSVNDAACQISGYSEDEFLNLTFEPLIIPEDLEKVRQHFAKAKEGKAQYYDTTIFSKNGNRINLSVSNIPIIVDNNISGVFGVAKDITERKKMEEQLIIQDRLASIGQLTSGVAHELNNPLTSVIGFSGLLLQRELPDDIKQDLKTINDEAQRTAKIVKNLLTFARKQPQEKQPMDINESIQRVLELRAYEQKVNHIQVTTHFAPDLPQIYGNTSQLQQVFFNLIINAEFFMLQAHARGTLTITTERIEDYVRASFTNDGPGIPKENMSHLFNPFYTTKEVGKGTGLGLSVCLGIITEHSGRIWAESEPGKGASFIVELPVHKGPSHEEGTK